MDMRPTITPKSDQLNADDLIAGPRTVTITAVKASPGSAEQPVAVYFEGDGGKPYMPCKSMRRVMVAVWGPDASQYAGRAMTLYRDPEVTWGGMAVGGIRISHMSGMDREMVLALTATKRARKPFTVQPLAQEAPREDKAAKVAAELVARVDAVETGPALYALVDDETVQKQRAWLKEKRPELSTDVEAAFMAARQRTETPAPGAPSPADDIPG